ncbi:phosphotransferase enzyme family protein [Niveispirillum sp. KHB5.9]|uniref:phosphotransferase enzyme family protein n=1 Tax=Niveispirillum sp. KHB5.9 TaxID=3400269 RepID=UPI003A8C52C8
MADFYQLSDADQARHLTGLARAALARWDGRFSDPVLFKYRENAVFTTHREDGARFALRVHRAGYHGDSSLRSELYWMRALGEAGIPVPPVLPAADGSLFVHAGADGVPEVRQVDMLGWLSGGSGPRDDHYFRIGQLAARLHSQGSQIPLPADFDRHSWDAGGLLGENPVWGRFWELPALSADQRDLLLRARERALADLADYGKAEDRYGMIHADLIRDNLIPDGDRLQAIDFDDCGFGWYLFELATVINAMPDGADPVLRGQLFAGYRSIRPLPDLDQLPLFRFLRATTYLGWLQTRSETQTAREKAAMLIDGCCRLANEYLNNATGGRP